MTIDVTYFGTRTLGEVRQSFVPGEHRAIVTVEQLDDHPPVDLLVDWATVLYCDENRRPLVVN